MTQPNTSFPDALQRSHFALRPELTREDLRRCESWLGDAAFEAKIAALWPQGAWLVMRGFPTGLWADLAQLDPAVIPGGEGACLGDAHFDNFGFVQVPGDHKFRYAADDLDDGGPGLVAIDALKYFAVLAGQPRLQRYLDLALERYVAALQGPGEERRLPKHLVPRPETVREKKLARYVAGGRIKREALQLQVVPLDPGELAVLQDAVAGTVQLRGSRILDAVDLYKLAGGSYGVERYWLLLERGGLDIVELKALTTPATSFGRQSGPMTQEQRLQFLRKNLWGTDSDEGFFPARLGERDFLVRSRLARATLAPLELDDQDETGDVLEAQVSYLAAVHRPALAGVERERLRRWLRESATVLLERWRELVARAVPRLGVISAV